MKLVLMETVQEVYSFMACNTIEFRLFVSGENQVLDCDTKAAPAVRDQNTKFAQIDSNEEDLSPWVSVPAT